MYFIVEENGMKIRTPFLRAKQMKRIIHMKTVTKQFLSFLVSSPHRIGAPITET